MPQKWNVRRICKVCNKVFYARMNDIKSGRGIYCSWKCSGASKKKREIHECKICGSKFEVKLGRAQQGFGQFCSRKCFFISYKPKIKRCICCNKIIQNRVTKCIKCKLSTMPKGEANPNWKGGVTSINASLRASTKYKNWRTLVFKRDNWTCQECGQIGGELEVHHIRAFSLFPKLRFKKNNGITLCKDCHSKYPRRYPDAKGNR